MGRKSKDVKDDSVHVLRACPGSMRLIIENKTRGVFYCEDDEGVLLLDNSKGKMKQYRFDSMEECIGKLVGMKGD